MLRTSQSQTRLYKQMGIGFVAFVTFLIVFVSLPGGRSGGGGAFGDGGAGSSAYLYGGGLFFGAGTDKSPYALAMSQNDAGFEADSFILKALVSNPRAKREMIHPSFAIPKTVRALTAVSLERIAAKDAAAAADANNNGAPSVDGAPAPFFPTSMAHLRGFLERGSASLRARFNALYEIEAKTAVMKVPDAFAAKAKAMFALLPGGLAGLENQTIVTMYNKFTDEYSLFNEVRRFRPGYQERLRPEQEAAVNASYNANSGAENCDFCSMSRTAEDVFGRIESKHCYVASNVAKYESWHSLIVSKHHSPLTFNAEIIQDYFATSQRWFEKVNSVDRDAVFPFMSWDAGPRASASQVHQHLQVVLTHDRYLSKAENTRRAASVFERRFVGKNYWAEVAMVHSQMGLALSHGNSVVISHSCPVKEREMIVVTSDHTSPDFAEALNAALESLRDDIGVRALSMGVSFTPVGTALPASSRGSHPILPAGDQAVGAAAAKNKRGAFAAAGNGSNNSNGNKKGGHLPPPPAPFGGENPSDVGAPHHHDEALEKKMLRGYPTIARIIDRGTPNDVRSDTGAMEYFGANNVGADPYLVMPHLRRRLAALGRRGE